MNRVITSLLLLISFAGCTTTGRVDRRLPEGYVATPHGLVHRSCVRHIPNGHRVTADGVVTRADGGRETLPPCAHPRLHPRTLQPIAPSPATPPPPDVNGWVERGNWTSGAPLGYLAANFIVPQPPASNGALIYFFPGSSPSDGSTILQPVLQYGYGAAGGGNYWSAASWFCCPAGWTTHSDLINVNTGDTISGTMTGFCSGGNCNWSIATADTTTGVTSVLGADNVSTPFVWNFGGVLEAYSVTSCEQYPADGAIAFTSITLQDQNGNPMQPDWSTWVAGGLTPDCGYSVTVNGSNAMTLTY